MSLEEKRLFSPNRQQNKTSTSLLFSLFLLQQSEYQSRFVPPMYSFFTLETFSLIIWVTKINCKTWQLKMLVAISSIFVWVNEQKHCEKQVKFIYYTWFWNFYTGTTEETLRIMVMPVEFINDSAEVSKSFFKWAWVHSWSREHYVWQNNLNSKVHLHFFSKAFNWMSHAWLTKVAQESLHELPLCNNRFL